MHDTNLVFAFDAELMQLSITVLEMYRLLVPDRSNGLYHDVQTDDFRVHDTQHTH